MTPTLGKRISDGGFALLALLAAATLLRLVALDAPLWLDEILMLEDFIRAPLGRVLTTFPSDNHHPLYSMLAWVSAATLGESATAIRLPAVMFGVAGLALAYGLGRRFLDRGPALFAVAALALAPQHVWFSQNARGYTAVAFFALWALDTWVDVLAGRRESRLPCATALGLAVWTHLTAVFLAAGCAVGLLVDRLLPAERRSGAPMAGRDGLATLAGATVIGFLLHVPMLGDMYRFFLRPVAEKPDSPWKSPLWTLGELAQGVGAGSTVLGAVILAIGIAALARGLGTVRSRAPGLGLAATAPLVLAPAVTFALGRHLWPRFFFAEAAPCALIALAGALSVVPTVRPALARAVAIIALVGLATRLPGAYAPKQDFAGAAAWIAAQPDTGSPVICVGTAFWALRSSEGGVFTGADDATSFSALLDRDGRSFIVSASPIFVDAYRPGVGRLLVDRCERVRVFPSTLGDVEIYREKP